MLRGQFDQKEALALMPLTSCALHWSVEREAAWAIVSLRKNDTAFFEIGLFGLLGETKRDLGRCDNVSDLCRYILSALTGQSKHSSTPVSSSPGVRDFRRKDL